MSNALVPHYQPSQDLAMFFFHVEFCTINKIIKWLQRMDAFRGRATDPKCSIVCMSLLLRGCQLRRRIGGEAARSWMDCVSVLIGMYDQKT